MHQQLTQLSIDTDGRYATDAELQFLENYIATVPVRLSTYEKIRDHADELIVEMEDLIQRENPQILMNETRDMTSFWRRDMKSTMRHATAALLMNDIERFKDCYLLWLRAILQAHKADRATKVTYAKMPKVLEKFLTPAELAHYVPLVQLSESILG